MDAVTVSQYSEIIFRENTKSLRVTQYYMAEVRDARSDEVRILAETRQ